MFSRFGLRPGSRGTLLAWGGLLLMVLSLGWLEWTAGRGPDAWNALPRPHEPFAVVVIDPGHGGQDSGAMVGQTLEKDLTLDIAQRVDRLLQAQGMATVMTRVGDSYVSLAERAALTNRVSDCIMVSIHFNEGNKAVANGIETYYADHQIPAEPPLMAWLPFLQRTANPVSNGESQSLADFVQEALVKRTQASDRGTKAEQFFVIAKVHRPAVLVEGGFLSNKDETTKLANPDYRERMAGAISEGIFRYRDALRSRQLARGPLNRPPTE